MRVFRRHHSPMMTCKETAAVLQRYLDGRLDERAALRAAAHLEVCRRCGLELETYRTIKHALSELGAPPRDAVVRLHEFAAGLGGHHGDQGSI